MDAIRPPPRPRRRAIAVYLSPSEIECINKGAKASGKARAAFMRSVALYRAGWQGYSGPLFERTSDAPRLEQHQVGDGLHEALRTLRELGTTVAAIYERGAKPNQPLLKLMLGYARLVTSLEPELRLLRHFDDTLDIVFELERMAAALAPHHGIASGQIEQVAAAAINALQRKEPDNGQGQTESR